MSSPHIFNCRKCGVPTDHSRLNDPVDGELWRCVVCGWKSLRDESKSWAKVRSEYAGSSYEQSYETRMKDPDFAALIFHMVMYMSGVRQFREFTAAERNRICALVVENWDRPNEDIAVKLKDAGFGLGGDIKSQAECVASIRRTGEKEYQEKISKSEKRLDAMTQQQLEVEADSLDEARQQLKSQLPKGIAVLSEEILCNGRPRTVQGIGETGEEAIENARLKVPDGSTVMKETVVRELRRRTVEMVGYDEQGATRHAQWRLEDDAKGDPFRFENETTIESISLKTAGRKGFFGWGRRVGVYNVTILDSACAEVTYKQKARIRATTGTLSDKFKNGIHDMNESEITSALRDRSEEETIALLDLLMKHSGDGGTQTLLAAIDLLTAHAPMVQERAIEFLLAKNSIPSMAWKIAYELRERALFSNELVMPASQFIAEFAKTHALGKEKAQLALEYVRSYPLDPAAREKFEERFGYFSRKENTVSQSQLAEREKNKTLCRQCGGTMRIDTENVHVYGGSSPVVMLRCDKCDITRLEKHEDVYR